MKYRWIQSLPLLMIALLSAPHVGCQPASCEKVCETQSTCNGASAATDCASACETERAAAVEAGCESEYDAKIDCQGTLNACATQSFCSGQEIAYANCLSKFTGQTTTTTDTTTTK